MPESRIPRIIQPDDSTELFTMAHMIESMPQPLDRTDAIAVMPGLGEDVRLTAAVSAWERHTQARYLLVAGTNPQEHAQRPTLSLLQTAPVGLRRIEGVVTQVEAQHTRQQAEWLNEQIYGLRITSVALFVTHWHLPRAYSTLVKTMQSQNVQLVPIFAVPVGTPPNAIVPETNTSVVAMSAGEAARIRAYQAVGHVATLVELQEYLQWLWEQDTVPIYE